MRNVNTNTDRQTESICDFLGRGGECNWINFYEAGKFGNYRRRTRRGLRAVEFGIPDAKTFLEKSNHSKIYQVHASSL
jgi:hypothetical protein